MERRIQSGRDTTMLENGSIEFIIPVAKWSDGTADHTDEYCSLSRRVMTIKKEETETLAERSGT